MKRSLYKLPLILSGVISLPACEGNITEHLGYPAVYRIDEIPLYEPEADIHQREQMLATKHANYVVQIEQRISNNEGEGVVNELIDDINHSDGYYLVAMDNLLSLNNTYPSLTSFTINRFVEETDMAKAGAITAIHTSPHGPQIQDLDTVTPTRHYLDYVYGLSQLGFFSGSHPQKARIVNELENFIDTYIEDQVGFYDGEYLTTGYNKEVFALDIASTVALLYSDSPGKYQKTKDSFESFWHNVIYLSYDGDNSPHYDAGTGFNIIMRMALRHQRLDEIQRSEHMKRMMDRMARTITSSGQSAKWGKSMEKSTKVGEIRISAGGLMPWMLMMGYKVWDDPYYLYVARKYQDFYLTKTQTDNGTFSEDHYPLLSPSDINAFSVAGVTPDADRDLPTRTTPRITSIDKYNGLLLGRGDTNYEQVQDKLMLSTGTHPQSPWLLMDLSYTQHKAAHDHRQGIDVFAAHGAHLLTRKGRWAEANKNNSIYIAPAKYDYPHAPYTSYHAADANMYNEEFMDAMEYNPRFDYKIADFGTQILSPYASYGFVGYDKHQYDGISSNRQVMLLNNGILAVKDTIETDSTYSGDHKGGVLYQVLPHFIQDQGANWVYMEGLAEQIPSQPSPQSTRGVLIYFPFISANDAQVNIANNPDDPENAYRSWFNTYKTLTPSEKFTMVSVIIPVNDKSRLTELIEEIHYEEEQSLLSIPYTQTQSIWMTLDQNNPQFKIE